MGKYGWQKDYWNVKGQQKEMSKKELLEAIEIALDDNNNWADTGLVDDYLRLAGIKLSEDEFYHKWYSWEFKEELIDKIMTKIKSKSKSRLKQILDIFKGTF